VSKLIVLGFDTATHSTVVGLRLADGSVLRARDDPAADKHPGHATRLLGMIDGLLERGGVGWRQLERIAVGLGPGRFTGLRVGVATARGLAQSLALGLAGVSSLQALAAGALRADTGGHERVLAVIDALRGEVFVTGYAVQAGVVLPVRTFARALAPEELAAQVARDGRDAQASVSPHVAGERPWLAVGDGALRYRAQLEAAGITVPPQGSPLHALDGAAICELGALATAARSYEELAPDYRRVPDAARVRTADGRGAPLGATAGARR
jgi:tRNA threonylcarbamoyladenosine biosynthesis protein TsaB